MGQDQSTQSIGDIKPAQTFEEFKKDLTDAAELYVYKFTETPEEGVFRPPWNKIVVVMVSKVNKTGMLLQRKNINFFQFYKLYSAMKLYAPQGDEIQLKRSSEAVTQKLMEMDEIQLKRSSEANNEGEHDCVICMERPSEIVLQGCNHEFCEKCIKEWNQKSQTCPICRREATYGDDDWIITGRRAEESVGDYFVKFFSTL